MIQLRRVFPVSFALVVLFSAFFFGRTPAAAADVFGLTMYDVNFVFCFGASVEGNFKISAADSNGAVVNSTVPVDYVVNFESNLGTVSGVAYSSRADETRSFAVALGFGTANYMRIYAVSVDNPQVRTDTWLIDCDGTITNLGGGTTTGSGLVDDRINRGHGDLINILYVRPDRSGQQGIQVYGLATSTQGVLRGYFPFTLFEPYLSDAPASSVKLATVDESTLYALASGEFQINIGPDAEGKTYILIFSGMPPRNIRFSQFNLYAAQGR